MTQNANDRRSAATDCYAVCADVLRSAETWEEDACLLGNVRAADIANAMRFAMKAVNERKRLIEQVNRQKSQIRDLTRRNDEVRGPSF